MKHTRSIILAVLLWTPLTLSAELLKVGSDIERISKAMEVAGYHQTGLSMVPTDRENEIRFWSVDEGVLISVYSTKTQKVVNLSYWFSDERPKAFRKTFDLAVVSFDTESGVMSILTSKPRIGEQGGSDQPATAPESKSEGNKKLKP